MKSASSAGFTPKKVFSEIIIKKIKFKNKNV